jgi:hypothetical protein
MRLELTRARESGLPWSSKRYTELVTFVMRDVKAGEERADWLIALREQARMWQHAYERTSDLGETRLELDLLEDQAA